MLKSELEANDDNYKAQPCVLLDMPEGNEKAEGTKLELVKMENGELSVSSRWKKQNNIDLDGRQGENCLSMDDWVILLERKSLNSLGIWQLVNHHMYKYIYLSKER